MKKKTGYQNHPIWKFFFQTFTMVIMTSEKRNRTRRSQPPITIRYFSILRGINKMKDSLTRIVLIITMFKKYSLLFRIMTTHLISHILNVLLIPYQYLIHWAILIRMNSKHVIFITIVYCTKVQKVQYTKSECVTRIS